MFARPDQAPMRGAVSDEKDRSLLMLLEGFSADPDCAGASSDALWCAKKVILLRGA
jgi:hypothetical protein